MAKLLEKIETISCMGDKWHNQTLDILYAGADKRSKYFKQVNAAMQELFNNDDETRTQRWLFVVLPNSYARKVNGIMKSKSEKTFQKRLYKYIVFLINGTHYGALFNKRQILALEKLLTTKEKKNAK